MEIAFSAPLQLCAFTLQIIMKKISIADQIGNVSPFMAVTAITVYMLSFFAALVIAPQHDAANEMPMLQRIIDKLATLMRITAPASADKSSSPAPASQ